MSVLSPALLTQSLYRYAIVAVPLSCLALGLGVAAAPAVLPRGAAACHACPAPGQRGGAGRPGQRSGVVLP